MASRQDKTFFVASNKKLSNYELIPKTKNKKRRETLSPLWL
jgi:hypothetical protein